MKIECFPSGPFATNAYLVGCKNTKEACVIDPAPGSSALILEKLAALEMKAIGIWLTHSHWDHFGDLALLKDQLRVPVWVHPLDAPNITHPGQDGLPMLMPITGVQPDYELDEGQRLLLGEYEFEVIHTPGHSPGGVCFYCAAEKVLFSGDTLFKGSIGNLSFPTSNANQMWKSLDQLSKLPGDTQVFPGHGESTQLSHETWLPHAKEYFS